MSRLMSILAAVIQCTKPWSEGTCWRSYCRAQPQELVDRIIGLGAQTFDKALPRAVRAEHLAEELVRLLPVGPARARP